MEESTSTNQPQQLQNQSVTNDEMLAEILETTRKTKQYMKWQLIITVALVVLPLIAMVAIVPFAMKSLSSAYGIGSDLESIDSSGGGTPSQSQMLNELLK